jgi:hypothetical protein
VCQIEVLATEVGADLGLHGLGDTVPRPSLDRGARDTNGCGEIGASDAGPLPRPHHLELLTIQPLRLSRGFSWHVREIDPAGRVP